MRALLSTLRVELGLLNPWQKTSSASLSRVQKSKPSLESLPYDIMILIINSLVESANEPYLRSLLDRQWHPLGALSKTNRHLRNLCFAIPVELVTLNGDTSYIVDNFRILDRLPSKIRAYIKSLRIYCVPSSNLAGFSYNFVNALAQLPNLEKLQLVLEDFPENYMIAHHHDTMIPQNKFSRVGILKMMPYNPYLLKMCPSVMALDTTNYRNNSGTGQHLIGAWAIVELRLWENFGKLRHLILDMEGNFEIISLLKAACPLLETLNLERGWAGGMPIDRWHPDYTSRLIFAFRQFNNLTHLIVPQDGPSGLKDLQGHFIDSMGTECPKLKFIIFGGHWKAKPMRENDDSVVGIIWLERGIEQNTPSGVVRHYLPLQYLRLIAKRIELWMDIWAYCGVSLGFIAYWIIMKWPLDLVGYGFEYQSRY